jgi:DNA-directed RNA polymerase sigma subunit (sigma70/sigma32)
MNLRQGKGKVPIHTGGETPWRLVRWPTREAFDDMFKRSPKRDQIWEMLRARSDGATLEEVGGRFGVSRERVRELEARFQRLMRESLQV